MSLPTEDCKDCTFGRKGLKTFLSDVNLTQPVRTPWRQEKLDAPHMMVQTQRCIPKVATAIEELTLNSSVPSEVNLNEQRRKFRLAAGGFNSLGKRFDYLARVSKRRHHLVNWRNPIPTHELYDLKAKVDFMGMALKIKIRQHRRIFNMRTQESGTRAGKATEGLVLGEEDCDRMCFQMGDLPVREKFTEQYGKALDSWAYEQMISVSGETKK